MKLNFRNMPFGSLPYDNIQLCKQMMLRLYEGIPYLAELPLIDKNDNVITKTLDKIPGFTFKDGKILLPESNNAKFTDACSKLDEVYNSNNLAEIEKFAQTDTPFTSIYYEMLKRLTPEYTVINLVGPFTIANSVFNRNPVMLLTDKVYRKFIIQMLTIKALSYVSKIKSASPKTTPIVLFEENLLYKYGSLKRTNEQITKDIVISLLAKVFSEVHQAGAVVGVQSFEKCNWKLVFEAGNVDLISFDAYNNPNNLNIINDDVNRFLAKGGYINWGIIPVTNEIAIRNLNVDNAYKRLTDSMESLINDGVSADLLYRNATISIQGNMSQLPILFAEKALMITNQVSKKLPFSSAGQVD